jgi:hypothetical protein
MRYKLKKESLNSRRGKYTPAILESNPLIWEPQELDILNDRHRAVIDEVGYASLGILATHKYWKNEPLEWIDAYQHFYNELFSLTWLHKNDDRHNIAMCRQCCLTSIQYHNHRLIAYSRSTDMRNGYFSDKLILDYLAERIAQDRPDCKVKTIEWYLAVPHVYNQKGVARLLEGEEIK